MGTRVLSVVWCEGNEEAGGKASLDISLCSYNTWSSFQKEEWPWVLPKGWALELGSPLASSPPQASPVHLTKGPV